MKEGEKKHGARLSFPAYGTYVSMELRHLLASYSYRRLFYLAFCRSGLKRRGRNLKMPPPPLKPDPHKLLNQFVLNV